MGKAGGGKNIYGYPIGMLMLATRFPRIPGEIGNATTWDFPVLYKTVPQATPDVVVRKGAPGLLEPFLQAAREMEREGVRAISFIEPSCRHLGPFLAPRWGALRAGFHSGPLRDRNLRVFLNDVS